MLGRQPCTTWIQCPRRPEAEVDDLGSGVADSSVTMLLLETELEFSARAAGNRYHWAVSLGLLRVQFNSFPNLPSLHYQYSSHPTSRHCIFYSISCDHSQGSCLLRTFPRPAPFFLMRTRALKNETTKGHLQPLCPTICLLPIREALVQWVSMKMQSHPCISYRYSLAHIITLLSESSVTVNLVIHPSFGLCLEQSY